MESPQMPISIFRFNFQDDIMALITQFAKTHQNDDRKTYKEEWKNWFSVNSMILETEITRLIRLGYNGNVEYKMFNAGRYYFRKRVTLESNNESQNDIINKELAAAAAYSINKNSTNKNEKKRTYISTDKLILEAMDTHIRTSIHASNKGATKFTPAEGYNAFCKTHIPLLSKEIKRIYSTFDQTKDTNIATLIVQKFKKTYKNRYFMVTRK